MNKTEQFLACIDELAGKPIPEKVMKRAKESLLDYLAVSAAGAVYLSDKLEKYMEFASPESGDFMAVGTGNKLVLKEAVFLNGLCGHALDFDDGTNAGIIHLGSPIFSLLLPLAEKYDIKVDDLLRAAVIGYETSFTMAISIQPGHKAMGYHATGTCGILGAVIAASYMLGFTEEERRNAMASACVAASGMLLVLDDGSELKPYNVAKTALLALTALQLGKSGFKGHPDPLYSSRGYLKMMTGRNDIELKPLQYNGTYAIEKTYTKPYAACRYCHPAIEAAISMRNEYGIKPEDVEKINVSTYSLAVKGHDHTEIPVSASAKMSIPYGVAVGVIYGKAGLNEYKDETLALSEVKELTRKVSVSEDQGMSDRFPGTQEACVQINAGGKQYSKTVDFPKGEPENPMGSQEFSERYTDLMLYGCRSREQADRIYDSVMNKDISVSELTGMIGKEI